MKNDVYFATFSGDGSGRFSKRGSTAEAKVMHVMTDRQIQRLEFSVRAIEDVLETLTQEEIKLINLKYFEKPYTHTCLTLEMNVSYPTLISLKKDIIRKFAVRYGLI